jgi:hypothetical protein
VPLPAKTARSFAFVLMALAAACWLQVEPASAAGRAVVSIVRGSPRGAPLPAGFVGLSFEYDAVPTYAGAGPTANPVLARLIRNLTPGQTPMLRIGGDSADRTWWPVAGVVPPGVVDYALTPAWMQAAAALARAARARLILGINLAIDRPALAAAEAKALLAGIGRPSIAAFEIGNEPDVYRIFPAYRNAQGTVEHVRGKGYNFGVFMHQFSAVRRAIAPLPLAGPALGGLGWSSKLGRFIAGEPGVRLVTVHLYPLSGCLAPPGSPFYPTIPHLLSDPSTTDLARSSAPSAAVVHAHRLKFRVDELNTVTCGGTLGVSDTFASALWALDTLFAFDRAGVDGVNIHMFPGARYALFSVADANGQWNASVNPEYYGLLLFARAAPPGSRILPVATMPAGSVKVWATIGPDGTIRVVLINQGSSAKPVLLAAPPGAAGAASAEQLLAPSLTATTGVTLGDQSFGSSTDTGNLAGPPSAASIRPVAGNYPITLPPASATMLTWKAMQS